MMRLRSVCGDSWASGTIFKLTKLLNLILRELGGGLHKIQKSGSTLLH